MARYSEKFSTPRNTKSNKPEGGLKKILSLPAFLDSTKVKQILGFSLLLFSLYLLISIIGFIFSGDTDQSIVDRGLRQIINNPDYTASNPTGPLGAWLSDLIVNKWFGLASVILCYILSLCAVRLLGRQQERFVYKFLTSMVLMLWISLTLGFFVEGINRLFDLTANNLFLGGGHGYFVSVWLNSTVGYVGTFLIIVLTFIAIMILCFGELCQRFVAYVKRKREERRLELARLREEMRLKAEADRRKRELEQLEREQALKQQATAQAESTTETETTDELPPIIVPSHLMETFDEPAQAITVPVASTNTQIMEPFQDFDNQPQAFNEEDAEPDDIFVAETPINVIDLPLEPRTAPATVDTEETDLELTINQINAEETVNKNIAPDKDYDPTLDLENYQYPPLDLLEEHSSGVPTVTKEELKANQDKIVDTLRNYKIEIVKIKATIGPTVTLYEIIPAPGVKISKIKNLEDDIALSLAALGIRIIAPIPGAGTIGIEVPNQQPEVVSMRSIIASKRFQESKFALPIALGRTISNETYTFDLTKMPHLLVAGATGQGKSVGLNAIITSLLYKKHPSQLKFVMVDPKKVELSIYSVIEKHFLAKLPEEEESIITETSKVVNTLNSLCLEMDNRYTLLKAAQVRNIKEYNDKFVKRVLNPENGHKYLPYIVVIVDEFADLIMTAGKEVEQPIARIAQLARAIGIHLIIATQRPSTNIITGVIKANFPARIAFKVASMIDSRTILDSPGANQLIGRGDMLISVGSEMTRVQCAFVDTPEVDAVTHYIAKQQCYPSAFALPEYVPENDGSGFSEADLGSKDTLFDEAARMVVLSQQGSTSSIQRRFSIGYNRAGRIMDQLEAAGIVGPYEGSKARSVLVQDEYSLEHILKNL
ncbi:MAG: DNA translocase FtsK 4TM domain-containing protein [Marinifilaceae bacterium]